VTDTLPNVTFSLGRQWAGNIPVQRPSHPNDTLFFWAVEKEDGSLTAGAGENADAPWGIWLNGGCVYAHSKGVIAENDASPHRPGSSSMAGFFFENGPIRIEPDYSMAQNNWSWNNLMDYFWIDNPV
jgi:carboxypeptidase D